MNFLVDAFPSRQFSGRVQQVRYAPTTKPERGHPHHHRGGGKQGHEAPARA